MTWHGLLRVAASSQNAVRGLLRGLLRSLLALSSSGVFALISLRSRAPGGLGGSLCVSGALQHVWLLCFTSALCRLGSW